jgi:tetratricopeptide (TPR) repeat protein
MDKEDLLNHIFEENIPDADAIKTLGGDHELLEEYQFRKSLQVALIRKRRVAQKKLLHQISLKERVKRKRLIWLGLAASLSLLLVTVWILRPQSSTAEMLYAQYYQTFPNRIAPSLRDQNKQLTEIQKAFVLYDNGEYSDAIIVFKKLYESDREAFLLFYLGVSHMETGQFKLALQSFKELKSDDLNPDLRGFEIWYTGLCHLRLNEPAVAKQYLELLSSNATHPMSELSRKLISELP